MPLQIYHLILRKIHVPKNFIIQNSKVFKKITRYSTPAKEYIFIQDKNISYSARSSASSYFWQLCQPKTAD